MIIRFSSSRRDQAHRPQQACEDKGSFAKVGDPWEDGCMRKLTFTTIHLLAAGILLTANAQAQQTPAANTQQAPAAKAAPAPAAGAQKAPAVKTGTAAKPRTQTVLTLKTPKDKTSYAVGLNVGKNLGAQLHQQSVEVDQAILLRGVKDALAGGKTLLTDDEVKAALMQLQTEVRARQQEKMKFEQEKMKAVADLNKKVGADFLEANKAKEGVVTLASGLQYKVLTEGTGPKPTATDNVSCNYRGTLIDGTEFDSSYKQGKPVSFPVAGVIKGWTEALQLMPEGSKWQLFIPSEMAYGDRGADPRSGIGPGATLIFEVELLSIQDKAKSEVAPK